MKANVLSLFFLLAVFGASGQNTKLADAEAYFSAIIVSDMDASLLWYQKVFKLALVNRTDLPERGFSQANLSKGSLWIELIALDSALTPKELLNAYPSKSKIQGFFKFGFRVSDFDAWIAHLKTQQVKFNGDVVQDKASGKRMVVVFDPDGNRIQMFEK